MSVGLRQIVRIASSHRLLQRLYVPPLSRQSARRWLRCTDRKRWHGFFDSLLRLPLRDLTLAGAVGMQPSAETPSGFLALSVILGLPLVLWVYKCLMMYIFQRKIIYMGYVPLGSRSERLRDAPMPAGLVCKEVSISSQKGIVLSGLVLHRDDSASPSSPHNVIIYLQGNAGNPLHRIPIFDALLKSLPSLTIIAAAPRSYWTSSSSRPTQNGIIADYSHVLAYAAARYPTSTLTVYGHSLGGAAAVCLLAQLPASQYPTIRGLILENPFSSVPAMVLALYPQRWLPYHHMGPLVWDRWDAASAMDTIRADTVLNALISDMLVLVSERDEVVPKTMGRELFARSERTNRSSGCTRKIVEIQGALHEDAWKQRQWVSEMRSYLTSVRPGRRRNGCLSEDE
ncbi:alpha/beta-hydrolase [Artomyces pyxidatus]|uniref:Alpha/beta-hydrolase n=1 Tax=Artomyces pyxidatus TaxID=48021 RepID=A0ACB8T0C1_9AGAM|nr:alpha/beta-hydrolase [Artomyces pyxidatus]